MNRSSRPSKWLGTKSTPRTSNHHKKSLRLLGIGRCYTIAAMKTRLLPLLLLLFSGALFAQNKSVHNSASSAIYPIHEGFVDANGVLIYYTEFGRGAPLLI